MYHFIIKKMNINQNIKVESNENNNIINQKCICSHGCNHIFKSIKQKLLHHNKLDKFCHFEKINILILLEQFNLSINKLIPNKKEKENFKEYVLLIKKYNNLKRKIRDNGEFEVIVNIK